MALALGACGGGDSAGPGQPVDASAVIRVPAGYPWAGALVDGNGTRQVQGSGPATIALVAETGNVLVVTVQKGRSDSVSLQACIDLAGVDSRCDSTTAALGIVQVSGQVVNQTTLAEKTR